MKLSIHQDILSGHLPDENAWRTIAIAACAALFAFISLLAGQHLSLALAVAGFGGIVLVLSIAGDTSRGLPLLVISLPLVSVGVIEAGWSIRPAQLVVMLILAALLLAREKSWSPLPVRRSMLLYTASLGIAAVLGMVLASGDGIGVVSAVKMRAGSFRPLAQFVTLALSLAVLPIAWRLMKSERDITRAVKALLVISGLVALYGAYQPVAVALGWPLTDITQAFSFGDSAVTRYGQTRYYSGIVASFAPRSTFAESLHFGAYLAAIFPVCLVCWFGRDHLPAVWRRWPWASLTLLFGLVILLTLSRSSWIAAGVGGLIVIVATARLRRLVLAVAGLGGLYLLLLAFSQLSIFDSTLSPLAMLVRRLSALDLAMDPRWLYHSVLYQLFAGSPVWGIGLGNFALGAAAQLRMETLASAHSVWLAHLVEGGLIGAGALLVLVGAIARKIILGWRVGRRSEWRYPLIGVTAGLAAMSVQYLTFGDRFDPHFWFFAALALRMSVEAARSRHFPS